MINKKQNSLKKGHVKDRNNQSLVGYNSIFRNVTELIELAKNKAARSINAIMTATYWEIGRYIVEFEQKGKKRAEYGEELLKYLSKNLKSKFGKGFSLRNLRNFRAFYLGWQIRQTLSAESMEERLNIIAKNFTLSWSHYVRLLSVKNNGSSFLL